MATSNFSDSSPTSDQDPYASSTVSPQEYSFDTSNLPRPVPIIGPLLGYNEQFFNQVTKLKVARITGALKRPLNPEEANATAYWAAKQISIVSYSTPIGVAGGAWRCWDTRRKFRFPFYGPNMETFKPSQFPNGTVFYEGPQARQLWHLFRALFYVGFGKFAAGMLLGSYAMSVVAVGEMTDPRLKGLQEVFKKEAEAQVARKRAIQNGMQGVKPPPQDQQGVSQQETQNRGEAVERPFDDASPTGGMYFDESQESGKPTVSSGGGVREQGQPQPGSSYGRRQQAIQKSQQAPEPQDNSASPFMVFDDASPTNGQGMSANNTTQSSSSGSAWDRIRSGQRPATSRGRSEQDSQGQETGQSAWRRGSQNSESQSSFNASSEREARRYSREEAQKEFDAKIERERRGGDFSSGGGDQKRW